MQHEIFHDFNLDRVPTTCDGMSNMKHHFRHLQKLEILWNLPSCAESRIYSNIYIFFMFSFNAVCCRFQCN